MAKRSSPKKRPTSTKRAPAPAKSKTDTILGLLRRKSGASVEEMAEATGWQAHSVRGFLSGTVKKKLGLKLAAEKREGEGSRYFVRAS